MVAEVRMKPDWQNPIHRRLIIGAIVVVVFLFVYVEDWARDFVSFEATLTADAAEPSLRTLRQTRPTEQVELAVRQAARRIKNLHYVGDTVDGNTTTMLFVRTARLLRLNDDVTVRIVDNGTYREISAESRGRLHLGDLGRNTRNVRRLRQELAAVLAGSLPPQLVAGPWPGSE